MGTDVVFDIKDGKLAFEIETGKNKQKQISEKVKWLDKHFYQWIIICSRENGYLLVLSQEEAIYRP